MDTRTSIKKSVLEMYLAHPFPQWTHEERRRRLGAELARYRFLGLEAPMTGGRFLDIGCGTGNRSMLVAKELGVEEFVGLDHSRASLECATRVAAEEGFDRFTPVEGDLFNIPYPDESFDVVVSWGVLHHTHDPLAGLREMRRVCRKDGRIGLFLYNKWNHWRHNKQKARVSRLAGDNVEQRFQIAHDLYGTKPIEQMTPEEIVYFYDKYCHPYKSDHTIGETLAWFRDLGLSYWGSYPPLRLRDFLSYLQFRGRLQSDHPSRSRFNRALSKTVASLPALDDPTPPFKPPTILHMLVWQLFWAWQGRSGGYSGGASLSARRPDGRRCDGISG